MCQLLSNYLFLCMLEFVFLADQCFCCSVVFFLWLMYFPRFQCVTLIRFRLIDLLLLNSGILLLPLFMCSGKSVEASMFCYSIVLLIRGS